MRKLSLCSLVLVVCASLPLGALADDKPAPAPAKPASADPTKQPAADAAPVAQPSPTPAGGRPPATSPNRGAKVRVEHVVAIVNDAIILTASSTPAASRCSPRLSRSPIPRSASGGSPS